MENRIKQLPELQNQMNDSIHDAHNAQTTIELLRQYRHDVMNDLQLIRGFYQLKRSDQMLDAIQQAVDRAQKQTILSNFPDPNIALVLLEADIMYSLIDLEIVSTVVEDSRNIYSEETVICLRYAMRMIGQFSRKSGLSLWIDINFLQNQVIQILIYGKHENKSELEELRSVFLQNSEAWDIKWIEDHIELYV